eukprot:1169625-Prorocentrum_minimum.AAC.1
MLFTISIGAICVLGPYDENYSTLGGAIYDGLNTGILGNFGDVRARFFEVPFGRQQPTLEVIYIWIYFGVWPLFNILVMFNITLGVVMTGLAMANMASLNAGDKDLIYDALTMTNQTIMGRWGFWPKPKKVNNLLRPSLSTVDSCHLKGEQKKEKGALGALLWNMGASMKKTYDMSKVKGKFSLKSLLGNLQNMVMAHTAQIPRRAEVEDARKKAMHHRVAGTAFTGKRMAVSIFSLDARDWLASR